MPIHRTPTGCIPVNVAQHKPAMVTPIPTPIPNEPQSEPAPMARAGEHSNGGHQAQGNGPEGDMVWLRWHSETERQYAMLNLYLSLGHTRKLTMVAAAMGMSTRYVVRIAGQWQWQVRAAAYDAYSLDALAEQTRMARIDMSRRQAQTGAALLAAASTALAHIDPLSIDANAAANLALTGTKIERLALGESTENRAVKGGITIEWAGPAPRWAPQPGANSTRTAPEPRLTSGQPDATVNSAVDAEFVEG